MELGCEKCKNKGVSGNRQETLARLTLSRGDQCYLIVV